MEFRSWIWISLVFIGLIVSMALSQTQQLPCFSPVGAISNPLFTQVDTILIGLIYNIGTILNYFNIPSWVYTEPTMNEVMDFPVDEAVYYNYFAASVYCPSVYPDGPLDCCNCAHFTNTVTFYRVMQNLTCQTKVLITQHPERNEIVVTFRGTNNLQNTLFDFDMSSHDVTVNGGNVTVNIHAGFYRAQDSLHQEVYELLSRLVLSLGDDYRIVIVGHSLGGAMATITLFRLWYEQQLPSGFQNFSLVTYGSPRVGNPEFAFLMNRIPVPMGRYVNYADVVPHYVPVNPVGSVGDVGSDEPYVHHRAESWIINGATDIVLCDNDTVGYEDQNCSNTLAPNFSWLDHLVYFGVDYSNCVIQEVICDLLTCLVPIPTGQRVNYCALVLSQLSSNVDLNGLTSQVDDTATPLLSGWIPTLKAQLQEYYNMASMYLSYPGYTPPQNIMIAFDNNCGDEYYVRFAGNNYWVCAEDFMNNTNGANQTQLGFILQYTTLSIMSYPYYNASWLSMCTAAYVSIYRWQPSTLWPSLPVANSSITDPSQASWSGCAYWLNFVNIVYTGFQTRDVVQQLFQVTRNGEYSEQFWVNVTGKTTTQLWSVMRQQPLSSSQRKRKSEL